MRVAVVLIVAMVMMMGQTTDAWRFWKTAAIVAGAALLGKRDVEDTDFQANYKAAAEDGVFTDEEIKSVFGVDDNDLAKFIETYDMNDDGKVQVEEYKTVSALANSMTG